MKSLSLIIFACFVGLTYAFTFGIINKHTKQAQVLHATATIVSPPSWEELSDTLTELTEQSTPPPKVTLYRDTNGWCPFCERVWLILRAKNIPYDEQLISLQNKPDWYKALVPTTLVPAVLFHEDDDKKNERRIVWESSDIIEALDEAFPEHPMLRDTPEYDTAIQMNDDLSKAGFEFVYAGRNDTLTDDDKLERKAKFFTELDRLDDALVEQQQKLDGDVCFRLGEEFTAVDAIMIPTLERWRYQLPLTADIDILEGREGLKKWFASMDNYEPYSRRVRGDEYSWVATNSMFLRYFGGGEDKPDVTAAIQRADDAAARLSSSFIDQAMNEEGSSKKHSIEAAAKLLSNHAAIVKDCTRQDPQSQQHIERASSEDDADTMLRHVCELLLSETDTLKEAKESPLPEITKDGALAARVVASRLCVPRDMSAPAASILRATLSSIANRIEE